MMPGQRGFNIISFFMRITLLFFSAYLLFACNDQPGNASKPLIANERPQNFQSDFDSGVLKSLNLIRDSLKIDAIDSGYDSLQLRIWVTNNFLRHQSVFILKCSNGGWYCSLINYKPVYFRSTDSLVEFKKDVKPISQATMNTNFVDTILSIDYFGFRDYKLIPGYVLPQDPLLITVEIASKWRYKLIQLPSPSVNPNVTEAKKMNEILEKINSEFGNSLYERGKE